MFQASVSKVQIVGAAGVALALLVGSPAVADDDDGPSLVSALHAAFGEHHARAVHAKGVILLGSFTPTAEAARLCSASAFAGGPVPVTLRFSDFTGLPDIPDNAGPASPRGMAVKLQPPGGERLDVVAHSFNGFPVATAAQFGTLLHAIGDSGPDAPKPTALDKFLASHPVARTFLTTQKPPPASYASPAYFGVNAFWLAGAGGNRAAARFRFVPVVGEQYLDGAAASAKGPDYLREEIVARLAAGPVRFEWIAQLANPSDKLDDPSAVWPEARTRVTLGTITITGLAPDQVQADKELLFLPGDLPAGIEAADPMLAIRSAAYPISFSERQ